MTEEDKEDVVVTDAVATKVLMPVQAALYHLLACWDCLRAAELLIGDDAEISTESLGKLGSHFDLPCDVYQQLTAKDVKEWLPDALAGD